MMDSQDSQEAYVSPIQQVNMTKLVSITSYKWPVVQVRANEGIAEHQERLLLPNFLVNQKINPKRE